MAMFDKLDALLRLYRFDRPIGTLLLLWPTLWGLWIAAEGQPDPRIVVVFVLGTFTMRAAGCAINDFADRNFDGQVERTQRRPLATGELTPAAALAAFAAMLAVSLVLAVQLNVLALAYAAIGAVIAAIYPFLKRFTHLPQLWLGIAFSWGIPMAFAAQLDRVPALAWLLVLANFNWVVAYDTQYAMVDRDDDVRVGVKSTAILFAEYDRLAVALFQVFAFLALLVVASVAHLNHWFYLGWLLAAGFAVYQGWLCRQRDRDGCFTAFLNNNWIGVAIFFGIVLAYLPN